MIGRPHHVAYDCPNPLALARFYSALLGLPVTYTSADWVVVAQEDRTSGFAFQRSPGHVPPVWPDPASSQQVHLDVMVDDLDAAQTAVLALGATRLVGGDHVYADPAGHPFCLVPRPSWAPPVGQPDLAPGH
jgi:catechol 2,3-dioxygenase-like lactoylglutathione lyase family enzyme